MPVNSGAPGTLRRCRRPYGEIFGGLAHFLECTHLDLPDALPRHVELYREVFQCHWLVGQMSRLEDTTFTRVEHANRVG